MAKFFMWLNGFDFRKLVWVVPIVLCLHELEEWNMLDWYRQHQFDIGSLTNLDARTWLLFISLVGFVWTACSLIPRNKKITAYIIMPLIVFMLGNGVQHLVWVISYWSYQPGFIFGAIVTLPVYSYVIFRAVRDKLTPIWYPLVLLAVVFIPGLIDFAKSLITKEKAPPASIHALHEFSQWLARKLWY